MIIDAESINTGEVIDADLCIIGAGPAGLTLARQFIGSAHRVYLLESGGDRIDQRSVELADGDIVGHPYFPLSTASGHAVGGSSHLWDEWMRARPLDPIDFEHRPWVTGSGWPFGRDELEPYYKEAHRLLGLDPYDYAPPGSMVTETVAGVSPAVFRYSNTFDFERMKGEIDASANVCLVVRASALELVPSDDGSQVDSVVAASENPQRFQVKARVYVLAAGGVGNPRLLLLSRARSDHGLANSSGLVGTHFMEHPTMRRGVIMPAGGVPWDTWGPFRMSSGSPALRGALVPTVEAMGESSILNGMVLLTETDDVESSEALRSLAIVRDGLRGINASGESSLAHAANVLRLPGEVLKVAQARGRRSRREPRLQLSITVEQAPSATSRVVLGSRADRFGRPLPALDWRLGDMERRTVRVIQEQVDRFLREGGLGHVEGFLGEEWPRRVFRGEWHQLGTTRMSASPRSGVVDPTGRTHDVDNLYIAGGSVFPTVGYANPTLTIVAMSHRLATALEKPLRRGVSLGPIW